MKINLVKDLQPFKEAAKRYIDEMAEIERGKYITLGAGQAMVYAEKEKEARLFLLEYGRPITDFPILNNESAIRGIEPIVLAKQIVSIADQWRCISAIIEAKRVAHKELINAATSVSQIEAAKNITWL